MGIRMEISRQYNVCNQLNYNLSVVLSFSTLSRAEAIQPCDLEKELGRVGEIFLWRVISVPLRQQVRAPRLEEI